MSRYLLLVILLWFLLPDPVFGQEYSYAHYDITEGLAGSTVYVMTQDHDGFLWIGTETGVSRFDGTHFRNFTAADGLSDIEVLQIFCDSKGRVWMAPFRKSICFYYQGKIHNQQNDPMLGSIHLKNNVANFIEDQAGNVLVQEPSSIHMVRPDGRVVTYDSIEGRPIKESAALCLDRAGHFLVQADDHIAEFGDKGFRAGIKVPIDLIHPNYLALSADYLVTRVRGQFLLRQLKTGIVQPLPFKDLGIQSISVAFGVDSALWFGELSGCMSYNLRTGRTERYLPGKPVSRIFRDRDANLWFCTMGQGIFRLSSDEFRTRVIPFGDAAQTSIHSITKIGSELWVGNDRNQIYRVAIASLAIAGRLCRSEDTKNRILFSDTLDKETALYAGDNTLSTCSLERMGIPEQIPLGVKAVCKKNGRELLIATSKGVFVYSKAARQMVDTIWRERATTVFYYRDTTYVGTLNGLYRVVGRRPAEYLGNLVPFLGERISAIDRSADGILWVGSYGKGIIGYRHDSIVAVINQSNGLTSDICRNLYLYQQTLWLGTDKGLNRISLDKAGYPITRYGFNDGLGSNIVNVVMQDGSMVYVGTPAGLSYFDQSRTITREGCQLHLLSVMNGGKDRTADTPALQLSYGNRNIEFGFVGISYRSAGDITYRYRMIGLDSVWRTTRQTLLEYPVLPSGNYEFQLMAINKWGSESDVLLQRLEVVTPFWVTPWFDALVVAAVALATWGLVNWRTRSMRQQQLEKEQLNRKMLEIERMALQAQMNPHFIFNCLTSVQQYIVDQDILSANKYITGLAKLIRLTLHHSSQAFIRLADEIHYLSAYMALEKLRFKEKMEYSIDVDPQIGQGLCYIPPMLIQPYIENSIRHGLRHKKGGKGFIWVKVRQDPATGPCGLIVIVEDNGIGRERSARYKTTEHIEYQSKGMTMTADRIRMINAAYGGDIRVEVIDLKDPDGEPAGTKVVMEFKVFDNLPVSKKEEI